MTTFTCFQCKKDLEGIVCDSSEFKRIINSILKYSELGDSQMSMINVDKALQEMTKASPTEKKPNIISNIVIGHQCEKCESWFCSIDLITKIKYDFWSPYFICPKCKKKTRRIWERVLLSTNYNEIISTHNEEIKKEYEAMGKCHEFALLPNETKIFHQNARGGEEIIITDKRFLHGFGKPLDFILLNDIKSVDSFIGGGIVLGKKGGEEVKVEFRRSGEGFYLAADEINALRKMCEAMDVPFFIRILSAEEGKKIIGYQPLHYPPSQYTLVYYFNGKETQWPQICAKCLAPLDTSMVINDHVKIYDLTLVNQTATHWSSVYSAENLAKQPNTTFDVPYCINCKGTDTKPAGEGYPVFYSLWSTGMNVRPVKGYLFDFSGSVYLEFLNSEYAQLFVQTNKLT